MADLHYPYAACSTPPPGSADRAVDLRCGITWSNGTTLSMLRQAQRGADGHGTYLNVLRPHVSAPPPPPPAAKSSGFVARVEAIFWRAIELEGKGEIANSETQIAASEALIGVIKADVWEPAHHYLQRHKKLADGVSVDATQAPWSPHVGVHSCRARYGPHCASRSRRIH